MPSAPLVVLLLALVTAGQAQGQAPQPRDREVTVANETEGPIRQLFVFPVGAPDQGPDRIGGAALPMRAALRVPLGRTTTCAFEVRAVFDDGDDMRRRADVCRSARLVLSETAPRREVEVANDTDLDLRELYLWPSDGRDQGRDRLGDSVVPPGESQRLRLRTGPDCLFDLRAVFADETEERRRRVDLCRAARLGFGDPDLPVREVPVLNRARRAIRELYATPQDGTPAARWGQDRLGASVIEPRGRFQLRVRGRGCGYDLRAVFEDDREEVRRGLDLCAVQGIVFGDRAIPDNGPRRVTLVNEHRRPVAQAFLTAADLDEWGDSALGEAMLRPGARRMVPHDGECLVDLRIVFDTGAAEERRAIDVCAGPTVQLRPGWTVEERSGTRRRDDGPGPQQGRIRLHNAGPLPVVELYAEAAGAGAGVDRLGRTVLGAGESLDFPPPEDLPPTARCRADLTAVFRDGRALRLPALDLCAGEEVVLR